MLQACTLPKPFRSLTQVHIAFRTHRGKLGVMGKVEGVAHRERKRDERRGEEKTRES